MSVSNGHDTDTLTLVETQGLDFKLSNDGRGGTLIALKASAEKPEAVTHAPAQHEAQLDGHGIAHLPTHAFFA